MIFCHTVFLSGVLEPVLFHVHHIFSHFLIILHCVFLFFKIRQAHNLVRRPLPSAPAVKLAAVDPWRSRPCPCVRLCAGHLGTVRCRGLPGSIGHDPAIKVHHVPGQCLRINPLNRDQQRGDKGSAERGWDRQRGNNCFQYASVNVCSRCEATLQIWAT